MLHWMIIYPCGDRKRLDIAQVWSYEQDEWDLASPETWPNTNEGEAECRERMLELAEKHGKKHPKQRAYLT